MVRSLLVLLLIVVLAACDLALVDPLPPAGAGAAAPAAVSPIPTGRSSTARPPAPTLAPPATPVPSPTSAPPPIDELATLAAAARLPRDPVELAAALGSSCPAGCPAVARTTPLEVAVGDIETFWLTDFATMRNFTISAELRYAGPVVLMYVDQSVNVDQDVLAAAAQSFEQTLYPQLRALFGSEAQPGVDGDRRITILNARAVGGGVLGYFSARDTVPRQVNRFSNEREMVYLNVEALPPASRGYLDVLTHEFQHMIHRHQQPHAATWFNEGTATLAEDLSGFVNQGYVEAYLRNPDTQLTAWTDQPGTALAHYGAAQLFLRYVYLNYGAAAVLPELISADAGDNLAAFAAIAARRHPDIQSFATLFADWATANLLNDPQLAAGRYAYPANEQLPAPLPATITPQTLAAGATRGAVRQFGVDYLALPPGATQIEFQGATGVGLTATRPRGQAAWWSGRSDNSVATLTRAFDLRELATATLTFATWYEIENDYDFGFVTVSTDNGRTWTTLPGRYTTSVDVHGTNYGHGYTGISGSPGTRTGATGSGIWLNEQIDLTPYAGRAILLRFWQITDEGFNAPGWLIDDIAIPELDYSHTVESGAGDWQAAGFVPIDGELAQQWIVRLVRTDAAGHTSVETLPVDQAGSAVAALDPTATAVLLVMATTPYTTEEATYSITVRD